MRVCFWHSDKPRERILAEAFCEGVRLHGDEAYMRPLQPKIEVADADVVCMVGVKSNELFKAHARAGAHIVMMDKGYTRHSTSGALRSWEYWRVAVDAHHPTHYLMKVVRPHDRLEKLNLPSLDLPMRPWREKGKHILIAGSSQKYHSFYDIGDPTGYVKKISRRITKHSAREIIYRPKTSWKEAVPVDGTIFSHGDKPIADDLKDAWALVTHGSNAVFEAVLFGIPCIVTGDAVAKPISSVDIEDIEKPRLASDEERVQWLANLAYCQWTQPEFASGEAWKYIRPQIYG